MSQWLLTIENLVKVMYQEMLTHTIFCLPFKRGSQLWLKMSTWQVPTERTVRTSSRKASQPPSCVPGSPHPPLPGTFRGAVTPCPCLSPPREGRGHLDCSVQAPCLALRGGSEYLLNGTGDSLLALNWGWPGFTSWGSASSVLSGLRTQLPLLQTPLLPPLWVDEHP